MNLFLMVFCLLLLTVSSLIAQKNTTELDKIKFNGIWVFDAKASNADSNMKERYQGQDLTISYNEPEIKIIEPRTREGKTLFAKLIFYADGRGEKNKPFAFNENVEIDSVTNWDDGVLVRKYKINIYNSGKLVGDIKHVEKYFLSRDGTVLTITNESKANVTTNSPYGKLTSNHEDKTKRVYKKKQ